MLNKVEIIGRVGKEPEVRHTQTAIKVVNLTVAVSESWKDAQGEKQERTEWLKNNPNRMSYTDFDCANKTVEEYEK